MICVVFQLQAIIIPARQTTCVCVYVCVCLCVFCWDYMNLHYQEPFGCCTILRISVLTGQMSSALRGRVINTVTDSKLTVVSLRRGVQSVPRLCQLVLSNQIDTVCTESSLLHFDVCIIQRRLWHQLG